MNSYKEQDPEIYSIIYDEVLRQENELQMIASENYASKAVMDAVGSVLTNKYAEGYPQKRYYGGCEFVDKAEELASYCRKYGLTFERSDRMITEFDYSEYLWDGRRDEFMKNADNIEIPLPKNKI